jgi:hypothetical protein
MDLSQRAIAPKCIEQRAVPFRDVELRTNTLDSDVPNMRQGDLLFVGYACVTEASYKVSDWLGEFDEVVRAGAFGKTLSESADVPFKLNHDGITLARTKSGTMALREDGTGLLTKAALDPSSPVVQTIRSAMERDDLDEMSFAFWVTRQEWSPDWTQRDILEVNLNKGDVSVVNYGANPATAGAKLRARDVAEHLERLSADERREVFDRLSAEFVKTAPTGRSLTDALAALI